MVMGFVERRDTSWTIGHVSFVGGRGVVICHGTSSATMLDPILPVSFDNGRTVDAISE